MIATGRKVPGARLRRALALLLCLGLVLRVRGQESGHETEGGGAERWIWGETVSDRQVCRFSKAFVVPEDALVEGATLRVTADNSYQLFLDGREIGQGADWRVLIEYDVSLLLTPGRHVVSVKAVNDFDRAGMLLDLHIRLSDGREIGVVSDRGWKVAPESDALWFKRNPDSQEWPLATEIGSLWGEGDSRVVPLIYKAPVSEPVVIEFWQTGGFQLALAVLTACSLLGGGYLGLRLFIKSAGERVVRRERARIAADLHDDLGGGLTQLVLLGEVTRRDTAPDSPAGEAMGRVSVEARNLLRAMNEAVWLINSQRDTLRDFASYVAKSVERYFEAGPVRCRFEIQPELPEIPFDLGLRRNLLLAVKEAMHNILRHSGADEAVLEIGIQRQELVIVIRDNGKGFDVVDAGDGNGLSNMKNRVAESGGRFLIGSGPGGTVLEFRVPVRGIARMKWFGTLPCKRGADPTETTF